MFRINNFLFREKNLKKLTFYIFKNKRQIMNESHKTQKHRIEIIKRTKKSEMKNRKKYLRK